MGRDYGNERDAINPSHYRDARGECIDAMPEHFRKWIMARPSLCDLSGHEFVGSRLSVAVAFMMIGFCMGSAFKYRWRQGRKDDPKQEEGKALWYDAFALHILDGGPDPRDAREP